ncbi:MAG: hypothetical protein JWR42_1313, partial [Marmoricola sp.]|nr:hypothetical protein [Marmoricola sp.]
MHRRTLSVLTLLAAAPLAASLATSPAH